MEIFKTIIEYPNYKVSNLGRVYSLLSNKILKPIKVNEYLALSLRFNGKYKRIYIHQLVAMAFLNHKPNGFNIVVDHINNDKHNNNVKNIQLLSNRDNCSKEGVTSKYIGVSWDKKAKKWRASIRINKKSKTLGRYKTELGAYMAYRLKLKEINNG